MRRIGVWNTAFLGDAVLTLPLLQNVRAHFPDAEIDFYVRGGLAPLFAAHPAVTRALSYDKRGKEKGVLGVLSLARQLAERRYDIWISPHTSLRSGFLARATGAPVRVGYREAPGQALWYTHTVPRRFGELDEIERLLELLRPLHVPVVTTWPEIVLPEDSLAKAAAFFADLEGPVLGLHPGSTWATKCWQPSSFAEVGARAVAEGAHVVLFAGRGEEAVAHAVRGGITEKVGQARAARVHDLSNALSLVELAAYLKGLSCYVTNDSGPMHLAWAQRVPVAAIFGPTVPAFGFAPRGSTTTLHEVVLPCRPCSLHGPQVCPLGHHLCMKNIMPEQVWRDVRSRLWGS